MLTTGQLLNQRYIVTAKIGEGSFSQVYTVRDHQEPDATTPKVNLAVKVLLPPSVLGLNNYTCAAQMLSREAALLAELADLSQGEQQPYLNAKGLAALLPIPPQAFFKHHHRDLQGVADLPCLVMEYIDGINLEQWFEQQAPLPVSLSWDKFVDWFEQLVAGLAVLHQQQYVHRDIKPANIMLRPDGQLVIIDYGAARSVVDRGTEVTAEAYKFSYATAIGTREFMPHEQCDGGLNLNFDLYALGWTLIMLLTGEPPIYWRDYRCNANGSCSVSWHETLYQSLEAARRDGASGLTDSIYERSLSYLHWLEQFVGLPEQRPTSAVVVMEQIQQSVNILKTKLPTKLPPNSQQDVKQLAFTNYSPLKRWLMISGVVAGLCVSLLGLSQWWVNRLIGEAISLREQEKNDLAAEKLATALFLSPNNAEALNIMGMNHEDLGDRQAALKFFRQSVAVNPDYAWGHNNLARRYLLDNNLDQAEQYINVGLVLAKKLPPSEEKSEITSLLTKNLVWLLISRQEPDRALPLLEQGLRTKEMSRWQTYPIDKCFAAEIADQKRTLSLELRLELWRECHNTVKDWLNKEPRNEEPQRWAARVDQKMRPFATNLKKVVP